MKKILIFIFDGYADWECAYISSELNQNPDYCIKTIGFDRETKKSMGGFTVKPDYSIYDFPVQCDMLILPGGQAWIEGKNDEVISLIDYSLKKKTPIAAICNAVNFLANNNYLDQIKHTGNPLWYIKKTSPQYKGENNYIEKQVVRSERIITANGSAALEFTKEILTFFEIDKEKIMEWYQLNKHGLYNELEEKV